MAAAAALLPTKKTFTISGQKMTEELKHQLSKVYNTDTVRMNKMDDTGGGLKLVEFLRDLILPEIKTLEIADNGVGEAEAIVIARAFPNVERLDLSANNIEDIKPFKKIMKKQSDEFVGRLRHLKHLRLAGCLIDTAGQYTRYDDRYKGRVFDEFKAAQKKSKVPTNFALLSIDDEGAWPHSPVEEDDKRADKDDALEFMSQRIRTQNTRLDAMIDRGEKLEPFIDDLFPASADSLFVSPTEDQMKWLPKVEWQKPESFLQKSALYKDGIAVADVRQGFLGSCWVKAALAAMAQHGTTFIDGIIKEKKHLPEACELHVYYNASPMRVVVDSYLPTIKGANGVYQTIFGHSSEREELWTAMVEKAYAKLHGGYGALVGGSACESFVDFLNHPSEVLLMADEDFETKLLYAVQKPRMKLICAETRPPNKELNEPDVVEGIGLSHAHTVLGVHQVNVKGTWVIIVQLFNPWGTCKYKGPWSDASTDWSRLDAADLKRLRPDGVNADRNNGVFWMDIPSMRRFFRRVCICEIPAAREGTWLRTNDTLPGTGIDCGSLSNRDNFSTNPRFTISVGLDTADVKECDLLIELSQLDAREMRYKTNLDRVTCQYHIWQLPEDISSADDLQADFFQAATMKAQSGWISFRGKCYRHKLATGTYALVASAWNGGHSEFYIRWKCQPHVPLEQMTEILDRARKAAAEARQKETAATAGSQKSAAKPTDPPKSSTEPGAGSSGTQDTEMLQANFHLVYFPQQASELGEQLTYEMASQSDKRKYNADLEKQKAKEIAISQKQKALGVRTKSGAAKESTHQPTVTGTKKLASLTASPDKKKQKEEFGDDYEYYAMNRITDGTLNSGSARRLASAQKVTQVALHKTTGHDGFGTDTDNTLQPLRYLSYDPFRQRSTQPSKTSQIDAPLSAKSTVGPLYQPMKPLGNVHVPSQPSKTQSKLEVSAPQKQSPRLLQFA